MTKNKKTAAITILLAAAILIAISKASGFLIDVLIFLSAFIFTLKFRRQIAKTLAEILPAKKIIFWSALPFILFEELINNPPHEYLIYFLTVPILSVTIIILSFLVKRFSIKNIFWPITVYSILGVAFEVNLGAASSQFAQLPPATFVFMLFWVGISYGFLAIVPLTIQSRKTIVTASPLSF